MLRDVVACSDIYIQKYSLGTQKYSLETDNHETFHPKLTAHRLRRCKSVSQACAPNVEWVEPGVCPNTV